jgi:hypothetical protein
MERNRDFDTGQYVRPKLPAMFDTAFPFPIDDFYENDDRLESLSNVKMETPISVFNDTYSTGMQVWEKYLPAAESFDVPEGSNETSQSLPIIVQKIFLSPRLRNTGDYNQHEFFFVSHESISTRAHYSSQNLVPVNAVLLSEFQQKIMGVNTTNVIKTYHPMGFIFNYVEVTDQSQQIAYACGGLADVLNIWHVPLVPGMKLYIMVYRDLFDEPKTTMVPVASLYPPLEIEFFHDNYIKGTINEIAILEIGVLCTANARPPLQNSNYFLRDGNDRPTTQLHSIANTCKATLSQVQGNILRVKLSHMKWEYFA